MNVDTDMRYASSRAVADHIFRHYDGVPKVDGEVGSKKAHDPQTCLALAEAAMAERARKAVEQLRATGTTIAGAAGERR
jgi:fructose-bisphosphate aldolase class II